MPLPYHSRVAIFASPAAGITAIEIVHFTTFVKWAAIGIILVNGIFLPHKLQGVFTGVIELMHFVLNMTY